MPTLAPPPEPIRFVRPAEGYTPAARWSARDEGRLLTDTAERTFATWASHSEFLTRQVEPVDPLDAPLAYVTFPVEKVVKATFTYVGELQPMPIPELDD